MKPSPFALLAALSLAGCASQQLPATHQVTGSITTDAAQAASLISAYRVSQGLSAVEVDSRLNKAAEHQARAVAGQASSAMAASAAGWTISASWAIRPKTSRPGPPRSTAPSTAGRRPPAQQQSADAAGSAIGLARADATGVTAAIGRLCSGNNWRHKLWPRRVGACSSRRPYDISTNPRLLCRRRNDGTLHMGRLRYDLEILACCDFLTPIGQRR